MDRGTSALAGKKVSPVRMGKPAIYHLDGCFDQCVCAVVIPNYITRLVFTASVPFCTTYSSQRYGDGEDDEDPILSSVSPIRSSISHLIEKSSS